MPHLLGPPEPRQPGGSGLSASTGWGLPVWAGLHPDAQLRTRRWNSSPHPLRLQRCKVPGGAQAGPGPSPSRVRPAQHRRMRCPLPRGTRARSLQKPGLETGALSRAQGQAETVASLSRCGRRTGRGGRRDRGSAEAQGGSGGAGAVGVGEPRCGLQWARVGHWARGCSGSRTRGRAAARLCGPSQRSRSRVPAAGDKEVESPGSRRPGEPGVRPPPLEGRTQEGHRSSRHCGRESLPWAPGPTVRAGSGWSVCSTGAQSRGLLAAPEPDLGPSRVPRELGPGLGPK